MIGRYRELETGVCTVQMVGAKLHRCVSVCKLCVRPHDPNSSVELRAALPANSHLKVVARRMDDGRTTHDNFMPIEEMGVGEPANTAAARKPTITEHARLSTT